MTPNFATWPGTLLDATAKAAYKARLGELRADLEEARSGNDPVRASRAGPSSTFWRPSWPGRSGWAAATGEAEPLAFDGWLELLRVLSDLVAGAPAGEDTDTDGR